MAKRYIKKYIVKNCPCFDGLFECSNQYVLAMYCQDCANCLIKQVIEKCKKCLYENYPDYYDEDFEEDIVTTFANDILQLFGIEEIE